MPTINVLETYFMLGIAQAIVPRQSFFLDRYFADSDEFDQDRVFADMQKGDNRMAPFVDPRAGDIANGRGGYEMAEFTPPLVAPSRVLTLDDLAKRGFGEPLVNGSTAEERAVRLVARDFAELDAQIFRREEWMGAQTFVKNGLTVQEYIDDHTTGRQFDLYFYDPSGSNPTQYTVRTQWSTFEQFYSDVVAMCDDLADNGEAPTDLVIGSAVWSKLRGFSDFLALLDNRRYQIGEINPTAPKPGVTRAGIVDFDGFMLEIFVCKESVVDQSGTVTKLFPAKSALVTRPDVGRRLYGAVTQINYGEEMPTTIKGKRIPKLTVDQDRDTRKVRLASRPLLVPKTYAPWRYAANCVQ